MLCLMLCLSQYSVLFYAGNCVCETGYFGSFCSFVITEPPIISGTTLYTGQAGTTTNIVITGSNFVDNSKLTCKFKTIEVIIFSLILNDDLRGEVS